MTKKTVKRVKPSNPISGRVARRLGIAPVARKTARKPRSISKLKKDLDKQISLYVRQINAKDGKVKCYTCGRVMDWKQSQCGHFISRSYLATRFDLNNLRVQCVGCNVFGGGKPLDFEENLKEELGKKAVEEMKARRHKIMKFSPSWYEMWIIIYKDKLKAL